MRKAVRTLAVAASCIVVAAAVTGCGESDSKASADADTNEGAISLASYREEAEPLCEQAAEQMGEVELPSSFPATLEDFDTGSKAVLEAIEEPYTKLADLDIPRGHEQEAERFSAALMDAVGDAKELRRLVEEKNDDTDALWLPRTNVTTHTGKAMNEAAELGLDACTDLSFKEGS